MSKKRQKQFGAISIFFRTLITAFSIFVAIATILGCVKITQNAEETIEVGANVQNATIKWLFWDVSDKAVISINTVDTTKIGDYIYIWNQNFKSNNTCCGHSATNYNIKRRCCGSN